MLRAPAIVRTIAGGVVTASEPLRDDTQTWNNAGVTFTAWRLNVTDTASGASSLLLDLQVGGVSQFSLSKGGTGNFASNVIAAGSITAGFNQFISWNGRARMSSPANGVVLVAAAAGGQLTVATLPAAGTAGAGARAFVTDANATTFASVVAGGGSNGVPVYSDGTNWRIG